MNSTSTSTKIENDSTSKQILEYYKKYSQTRELTKYFSGTPLSYLPEINDDHMQSESPGYVPDVIIQTDVDIVLVTNPIETRDEQSLSSSSSVNHNLEWDSLADIGYCNRQIHHSSSIPASSQLRETNIDHVTSSPSEDRDNVKLIIFPYSSSSEESGNPNDYSCSSQGSSTFPEEKKTTVSSSLCSNPSINSLDIKKPCTSSLESVASEKISHFKNTLSYLKTKIGLPDAHSTPNVAEKKYNFSGITPVKEKIEMPVEHNISTNREHDGKAKISENELPAQIDVDGETHSKNISELKKQAKDLRREKVSNIEQKVVNLSQTKPLTVECSAIQPKFKDKIMQTNFEHIHVAVQTQPSLDIECVKIADQVQHKSIEYLHENHPETRETNIERTENCSELLSPCDSFEYVENNSLISCSETVEKNGNNIKKEELCKDVEQAYNIGNKSDSTECCQTFSEDFNIANQISSMSPDDLSEYIEKYINLFQRLLRSKKYDSVTKKRYLKKIMKKITESKYLEESSTSSDLFLPKKTHSDGQLFPDAKVFPTSTDSTDEKSLKNKITRNINDEDKPKVSPRKRNPHIKVHQDIIPSTSNSVEDSSSCSEVSEAEIDMKDNIIKVTKNKSYKNESLNILKQKTVEDNMHHKQYYGSNSTSKSYNNWKENKTVSEKIIERINLPRCDGDYLMKAANGEREYQINCIDTEINQLENLRSLLAEQPVEKITGNSLKMVPKTTSTYTVTEKSDNDLLMKRNFVIETNLDAGSSKSKYFRLEGKEYVVENLTDKNGKAKKRRQILADLEVVSSDTTTNIRVTTFCELCKVSPCICQCESLKERCLPKRVCYKCSRLCCSCSSSESKYSKSICSVCCTFPCSCTDKPESTKTSTNTQSEIVQEGFVPADLARINERSWLPVNSSGNCSKCKRSSNGNNSTKNSTRSNGTSTISSSGTVDGSLNKLFLNCKCNSKTSCNCGFVDKLLRHFNKEELMHLKNFESKISQMNHPKNDTSFNTTGVQVQANMQSQNSQTFRNLNHQIPQTLRTLQGQSQSIGVQTRITPVENKQLGNTQDSINLMGSEIAPEKIQQRSEHTQIGSQHEHTQVGSQDGRNQVGSQDKQNQVGSQNKQNQVGSQDVHTQVESQDDQPRVRSQDKQTQVRKQSKQTMTINDEETESKNSFKKNKRNAVSQTLQQNLSVNTGIHESDKTDFDDSARTNTANDRIDEITEKRDNNNSSNSSYICVSRYVKNASQDSHSRLENLEESPAGGNEMNRNNMYAKSSSVSTDETSSSKTVPTNSVTSAVMCICCKRKTTIENVSMLQSTNQEYPLCHHCLEKKPILTSVCYTGPTRPITDGMKATSNSFRRIEEYCTCNKQSRIQNSYYCCHCQFKLKRTVRNQNAIAYTLTLENETPRKFRNDKKKIKKLEEIKVKVPGPTNKKLFKNERNLSKRDLNRFQDSLGSTNETEKKDNEKSVGQGSKTSKTNLTLQEYLITNRPDFLKSAEHRRVTVVTHRVERELNKDKIKLKFIENNTPENEGMLEINRLFTEREMKEITKNNYKKLPEVQQRLNQFREQKLRNADKFIVDVFKKNIQDSVLKGKRSFPLNTNIVNMHHA